MVNKIYELKNQLLKHVEEEVARNGIERLNGDKVDMIKDLAEAECYCMKAKYYDTVTKAMQGEQQSGYSMGQRSMGYQSRDMQEPSGYGMGYMGYHEEEDAEQLIQKLKQKLDHESPAKREQLRNRTLATIGTR